MEYLADHIWNVFKMKSNKDFIIKNQGDESMTITSNVGIVQWIFDDDKDR